MQSVRAYICSGGAAFFGLFTPLFAHGQAADDPARLRRDIDRSAGEGAAVVVQDGEDLAARAESAFKSEAEKDIEQLKGPANIRAVSPTSASADSLSSIERDVESLEKQSDGFEPVK